MSFIKLKLLMITLHDDTSYYNATASEIWTYLTAKVIIGRTNYSRHWRTVAELLTHMRTTERTASPLDGKLFTIDSAILEKAITIFNENLPKKHSHLTIKDKPQ